MSETTVYKSRAARDAQASGYGNKSFWDYLEQSEQELHDKLLTRGDIQGAAAILARTLSESLMGNEGN